ncbi:Linear gramicidin dehydrogenase LgrE [compost metagenome]
MEYNKRSLNGMKLFCLPYAGGSATVFTKWRRGLDARIELIPVELSGRGRRFVEPFYSSLHDGVKDIFPFIMDQLGDSDYSLYGHSMGSLYICELMKQIQTHGCKKPQHLFLSGMYPPHIKNKKKIHHLPDNEFWQEIIKLGGTPKEVSENKELMEIFTPVMRSDYRNVEDYQFEAGKEKWDMDITILTGEEDEIVSMDEIRQWREYTTRSCSIVPFQGGHFFINEEEKKVIDLINNTL